MSLKKLPVRVSPLILPTYLALVEASVGSQLFRAFYASVNGKKTEVTRDGKISCAFFVSSVLKLFNLIQEVQITNNRLLRDMQRSGWVAIPRPRKGCIVIWKEKDADPTRMKKDTGVYQPKVKHCGFFIGSGMCVSNGGDEGQAPWKHPLTYRPIEAYFWHPALEATFVNPTKASAAHKAGIFWEANK